MKRGILPKIMDQLQVCNFTIYLYVERFNQGSMRSMYFEFWVSLHKK